jgi:signal transduction histidine kinase
VGDHTGGGAEAATADDPVNDVELVVDDDGPGVPVADRQRIFERFTRLEEARTRDRGGAGLGLAVVAETVRSLGGTVAVGDSPHGGARFTVTLPGIAAPREEMSG